MSTWGGFVCVAFVIDAYARRIVGWRASRTAQAGFVPDDLEQALHAWRPVRANGLIHHLGHGSQYAATHYAERLTKAGIQPSVGSVGNSSDNALAETVIGLFKTEAIQRREPWRSFEAVGHAIPEWVRLLEPIGNVTPDDDKPAYSQQAGDMSIAA